MLSERPDSGVHGPYSDGVPVLSWCCISEAGEAFGREIDRVFAGEAVGRPGETVTARALAEGSDSAGAEAAGGDGGIRFHVFRAVVDGRRFRLAVVTRAFSAEDAAEAAGALASALFGSAHAEEHDPSVTFCALDADGDAVAVRGPERIRYAASTIKLGVAIATLRAVDRGDLDLDETVESRHRFPSAIPGAGDFGFTPDEIDHGFPAPGAPVALGECLERMIEVSSNEGTNLLVQRLGLDAVADAFAAAGARTARMTRLIGDYAARDAGETHEASAADLAIVMRAIVSGDVLSTGSAGRLVAHLARQRFPIITDGLIESDDHGSKSGWVTGVRHDVAWFRRNGERAPSVLAVCTVDLETSAALETIRAIGAAVEQRTALRQDRYDRTLSTAR